MMLVVVLVVVVGLGLCQELLSKALAMTLPKSIGNDISKKPWQWHCQKALEMTLPKFEKI